MKQPSTAQIEATAEAIKDHFVPKDKQLTVFSFHFTIPPSANYKATYEKDAKGNWTLRTCEVDLG